MPKMRRYVPDSETKVNRAIEYLKIARDALADADAPKAADKVRRALKSAEGAYRHVRHRYHRTLANDRVKP